MSIDGPCPICGEDKLFEVPWTVCTWCDANQDEILRALRYHNHEAFNSSRERVEALDPNTVVKNIVKVRPKISFLELDKKIDSIISALVNKVSVEVTVMLRGREVFHPELAERIFKQIDAAVCSVGERTVSTEIAPSPSRKKSSSQDIKAIYRYQQGEQYMPVKV